VQIARIVSKLLHIPGVDHLHQDVCIRNYYKDQDGYGENIPRRVFEDVSFYDSEFPDEIVLASINKISWPAADLSKTK